MLQIKEKIKKTISTVIIFGLIFVQLSPLTVSAVTIPDSFFTNIAGNINNATNTGPINSANNDPSGISNKKQGPKIDVTFNQEGISQSGSMMTATAVPSFFNDNSDPKKLYFTWYLKRSLCKLTDDDYPTGKKRDGDTGKMENISKDSNNAKLSSCDLDGDEIITVNDWKIAAARITVKGSFDRSVADYSKPIDAELAGYKATPSPIGEWRINSGEHDTNLDDAPDCYIQEPDSGLVYEMRRVKQIFNSCPSDAAGNTYHRACVSDLTAQCDVLNPAYNQAAIDASNNSQAAIDAANLWNSDPANINDQHVVPAFIPIPTKTISNDFGACAVASESDDEFNCKITDLTNFKTTQSCGTINGLPATPICVRDNDFTKFPINATYPAPATEALLGIIFNKGALTDPAKKDNICRALAAPNEETGLLAAPPNFLSNNTNTNPISAADVKCSSVKDKMINGTKDSAGNIVIAGSSIFEPSCSFEKSANMCKHLFPIVPKNNVAVDGKTIDMDGAITGDGKFTLKEKQFWGASPTTASTNGAGKDEENIVGLGLDKFSWIFSTGDQVGVVVEGDSAYPTEHTDAKYKRMWAFSNNKCQKLEDISNDADILNGSDNINKRGFYMEKGGSVCDPQHMDQCTGFLTAEFDLDECLEENLLEPSASNNTKLKVQLSVDPQNPTNDPDGRGDILNVSASSLNSSNTNGLLYEWSVQKSLDGSDAPTDTTNWKDITTQLKNAGSFSAADAIGLGKKDLAINLNIQDPANIGSSMNKPYNGGAFYLRVKVKITGTLADGGQDAEGATMPPIRINQQQNSMHVYPISATDNGMISLNKGLSTQSLELCTDQQGKMKCSVTKNQILGLEVPDEGNDKLSNFSWTVNGNPISCDTTISLQCAPGGNKLFVPILGNEGEAVDVIAKALSSNGESVEVNRHFVISKPGLQISSLDPNSYCGIQCLDTASVCPKYLGFYKDLGGAQYPDCSTQVWQTIEGKTVTLMASGQSGFDWAIDGQIITEFKNQNQIQLKINKIAGESYNINLSTHLLDANKKQLNNTRLALYKHWGITQEEIAEENQSANIQLDVLNGSGQSIASAKPDIFGASLITHLPEQLMFMLKISLTSLLLLLVTGLLFAFIPETLFKKEK